jgi:hypothetical protein
MFDVNAVHAKGAKDYAKKRKDFCLHFAFFALYFTLRPLREPAFSFPNFLICSFTNLKKCIKN